MLCIFYEENVENFFVYILSLRLVLGFFKILGRVMKFYLKIFGGCRGLRWFKLYCWM